jgi:hypothetical protein
MTASVYILLFRSRWFALAWVGMMAASAIFFTTYGTGAMLVGARPAPNASEEAAYKQAKFNAWALDENRRVGDEAGSDPSRADLVRDGMSPEVMAADEAYRDSQYRSVPFSGSDSSTSQ